MSFKQWSKSMPDGVLKNLTLVNKSDVLYHISLNHHIKSMQPRIALTSADSEDRHMPRINFCLGIANCIYAYPGFIESSLKGGYDERTSGNNDPIFSIYTAQPKDYVIPNNKLVYDASETGEVWVVANRPEHTDLPVDKVGELFMFSANLKYGPGAENDQVVLLMSIRQGQRLNLDEQVKINGGFYRITMNHHPIHTGKKERKPLVIELIDRKTYAELKKQAIADWKSK